MKNSIDNNANNIESTMVKVLADEIDKLRWEVVYWRSNKYRVEWYFK